MPLQRWYARSEAHPGAPGLRALTVSHDEWRQVAQDVAAAGGRLVTLWASGGERTDPMIHAAFVTERAGLVLTLPIADPGATYLGIEDLVPSAGRIQRAMADI